MGAKNLPPPFRHAYDMYCRPLGLVEGLCPAHLVIGMKAGSTYLAAFPSCSRQKVVGRECIADSELCFSIKELCKAKAMKIYRHHYFTKKRRGRALPKSNRNSRKKT